MAKRLCKKRKSKPRPWSAHCPRCGKKAAHFIGPSFGDPGIWICESDGGKPTPQWKKYERRTSGNNQS